MPVTKIPANTLIVRGDQVGLSDFGFGFLGPLRSRAVGVLSTEETMVADSDAALSNSARSCCIRGVALGGAPDSVSVTVSLRRSRASLETMFSLILGTCDANSQAHLGEIKRPDRFQPFGEGSLGAPIHIPAKPR